MKILILIMAHQTNDEVFNNYKKIWDKHIFESSYYNIEFKFLYSDETLSQEYIVDGDKLISKCKENYWFSLLIKVLNGFDYFYNNDFDLVFKTNLSTLINFKKFYEYCEIIPKNRQYVYDGVVGNYRNFYFCSGAGMLLNKNSVKLILNNKDKVNEEWTDDIFIGYVLNELEHIQPNQGGMTRFDIVDKFTQFNREDILSNTHIRIKVRENLLDIEYSNLVDKYLNDK